MTQTTDPPIINEDDLPDDSTYDASLFPQVLG